MGNTQYTTVSGRVNIAHTPSVVSLICIFCFRIFKIIFVYILQVPQNKQIKVLSAPQKALCMTISNSQEIITTVEKELISKAVIPEYGNDAVSPDS